MSHSQEEFWVRLTNVSTPKRPVDGWSVIEKEQTRILYVPLHSTIRFTWTCVVTPTLLTNYPDSFSDNLVPITR